MGTLVFIATTVLEIILVGMCSAFAIFSLYIHQQHRKYAHLPGPKRRSFFLGNLGEVMESKTRGSCFLQLTSVKWRKEHGPIYVIYLLHNVMVFVAEPSVVKEVALNPENRKPKVFAQSLGWIFGQRIGGRGLFTETDHEKWSRKRKLFDPAFRRKNLLGLLGIFNQCADQASDYLSQFGDGKTEVRMADLCSRVTLDTIGKSTFGMEELDVIAQPENDLNRAITYIFKGGCLLFQYGIIAEYDPRKSMRDLRKEVREGGALIRGLAKESISERMKEIERGEEPPNDILSSILRASPNLNGTMDFGLEEMVDEFLTFFVAGQDTTGSLLASTVLCIARYPDIMRRLKEEVDEVINDKGEIGANELNKLEYMSLVFKETLRLYGPAGAFHRICAKEINACGYRIPTNTFLNLNHQAMATDERFFDEPEKFDPERWRQDDRSYKAWNGLLPMALSQHYTRMYAYFPFALGPRVCIGQNFALMEAKVVLGKFLQHFDISLVPGQNFAMVTEITTKPVDGTRCYVTSRKA